MIEVSTGTDDDARAWEDFLAGSPDRHHALSWPWSKVLPNVFGHEAHMLVAREHGKIIGICPLYHVKSMLFGSSLISVPYLNAGGVISERDDAAAAGVDDGLRSQPRFRADGPGYRSRR